MLIKQQPDIDIRLLLMFLEQIQPIIIQSIFQYESKQ